MGGSWQPHELDATVFIVSPRSATVNATLAREFLRSHGLRLDLPLQTTTAGYAGRCF